MEKKTNLQFNFRSATEKVAALEAIRDKLAKIECDIRQMIPVAEVKVQNNAVLEMMVSLLEAAATILPNNENMGEPQRLLRNVRHAYGSQALNSEMNLMITGTGSIATAFNIVMGMSYHSDTKVKRDYEKSIGYFHEAGRCGNTEWDALRRRSWSKTRPEESVGLPQ